MKQVFKRIVLFLPFIYGASTLMSQTVSNVRFEQFEEADVQIFYETDRKADVDLYVSLDGGKTVEQLTEIEGDFGPEVDKGEHTVMWHALKEKGEFYSDSVIFYVDAKRVQYPKSVVLTLNAGYMTAPQYSAGLTIGQFVWGKRHRLGWFVTAMSGWEFQFTPDGLCDAEGKTNGYMNMFNQNESRMRMSLIAGLQAKITSWWALQVGGGYGLRHLAWQTQSGKWLKNTAFSTQGAELTLGTSFFIRDFVFSYNAVTTNFATLEHRVGIGWQFHD